MNTRSIFTAIAFIALCGVGVFAQNAKVQSVTTIRDVDQPAKQHFTKTLDGTTPTVVTVPVGKVLIIESVTGRVINLAGSPAPLTLFTYSGISGFQFHTIAPTFHNPAASTTFYTHHGRFYVPAGHTAELFWSGDGVLTLFTASVSGYYVDVQ